MYSCKKWCVQNVIHNKLVRLTQNQSRWRLKFSGIWTLLGLLDPKNETWGTTCPYNTSHPKILQSSTQLTESQSCMKEVVCRVRPSIMEQMWVETDQNQKFLPSLPMPTKSHFDILWFNMPSTALTIQHWMNWNGHGRSCGIIYSTILAFAWTDRGKLWETSRQSVSGPKHEPVPPN